jgi:hypothetical protein
MMARRFWQGDLSFKTTSSASLLDVNYLVMTRMQEIRASQEQLDEKLRGKFFTNAFEYKPSDILGMKVKLPSRSLSAFEAALSIHSLTNRAITFI